MKETVDGRHEGPKWPIGLFVTGIIMLTVMLTVTIYSHPASNSPEFWVVKVMTALAAACIAAGLPGTIRIELPAGIRAGGTITIFVIVFLLGGPSDQPNEKSSSETTPNSGSPPSPTQPAGATQASGSQNSQEAGNSNSPIDMDDPTRVERFSEAQAALEKAKQRLTKSDPNKEWAIDDLNKAIHLDPNLSEAKELRTQLISNVVKEYEAKEATTNPLDQQAAYGDLELRYGLFLLQQCSDPEAALPHFDKALTYTPTNAITDAFIFSARAQADHQVGNYQQEVEDLTASLNWDTKQLGGLAVDACNFLRRADAEKALGQTSAAENDKTLAIQHGCKDRSLGGNF